MLGIDISRDAIEYGQKNFQDVSFVCQAISPDEADLGRKFSLIMCFEFYPFTRNADATVQAAFIQYFSRQLTPEGGIVIYQRWDNSVSLSAVLDEVKALCPELSFSIALVPILRMPIWVPRPLGLAISYIAGVLLGREVVKRVVSIRWGNRVAKG